MKRLVFAGRKGRVVISALVAAATSFAADLYFAGDSTLAPRKPDQIYGSWGDALAPQLAEGNKIVNIAKSGTSTKSFKSYWKKSIKPNMKAGDWVIIQFGINDPCHTSKERLAKGDQDRYCEVPEYKDNLRAYIADVRAKGAKPLFCTPLTARCFDPKTNEWSEKRRGKRTEYAAAMREVAEEQKVPLVDMEALSIQVVKASGAEGSKALYAGGERNIPMCG